MSDTKLKKNIEEDLEKGQYQKSQRDNAKLKEMASETKNRIDLRVEPEVKEAFIRMAEKEGIPYQTLINSVLKKYVDDNSSNHLMKI